MPYVWRSARNVVGRANEGTDRRRRCRRSVRLVKKKISSQTAVKSAPHGKLWGGRFRERTNRLVEAFTSSLAVDRRLYAQDVQGSIAHAQALQRAAVLTKREAATII